MALSAAVEADIRPPTIRPISSSLLGLSLSTFTSSGVTTWPPTYPPLTTVPGKSFCHLIVCFAKPTTSGPHTIVVGPPACRSSFQPKSSNTRLANLKGVPSNEIDCFRDAIRSRLFDTPSNLEMSTNTTSETPRSWSERSFIIKDLTALLMSPPLFSRKLKKLVRHQTDPNPLD